MWTDGDTKSYKVANFTNSDGEPFGLTIKGKGKHIDAHNKVMDTLNRLPKDKSTIFGDVKLTVTDKVKTNTIFNAKVTLTTAEGPEGQVEVKIHKPSDSRHKATIEVRKLTGFEFETVEKVKNVITNMIDDFTCGQSVSKVLLNAKGKAKPYSPLVKQPSLSVKLLACTECDFKIKNVAALKNHITVNHRSLKCKCDTCGFESGANEMESHNREFHLVHQSIKKQNKRKKVVLGCDKCGVTVDTQRKLRSHKESQHPVSIETSSSPDPSPPRKKLVKQVEGLTVEEAKLIIKEAEKKVTVTVEEAEVEMVDMNKSEYRDKDEETEV